MKSLAFRGFLWDMGAAFLVLLLPLLIFLKHHDYPLARSEITLLLLVVLLAGLLCGVAMSLGGVWGRWLVSVFLAVLVVDIQTHWITTWGLRLLLAVLFFGVLFWFLRRRLSQVVVLVAGVMILGTLVAPARQQVRTSGSLAEAPAATSDLPFILHVILDEHIGIEGIPRPFDPEGAIAAQVRDSYLDRGFRVFGRAYSRYYATLMSLPNLLNFTDSQDPSAYLPSPFFKGQVLERNAWFDALGEKGYLIHVLQPEYLTYDRPGERSAAGGVESSVTFASESIFALAPVAMPSVDKARFIGGSYLRLSFFLTLLRDGYGNLHRSDLGQTLGLPAWDPSGKYLSTLSSMNAVTLLKRDLEFAGPGRAFFVHLLLPHFPYVYREDCQVRDIKEGWLNVVDEAQAPRRNDDASRALRYPRYLDQLLCTTQVIQGILDDLSRRPWWGEAIVVIHGDHGSRLDIVPPFVPFIDEFTDEGLMDDFSTLFVIKLPGIPADYDRRQLPVQHLFKRMMRDGADPGDPDLQARPRVMIWDETNPLQVVDLPFFDHGLAGSASAQAR